MNTMDFLILLACLLGTCGGVSWLVARRAVRAPGLGEGVRWLVRNGEAISEKEMRRIFFSWPATDPRKRAAFQVLTELLEVAQLEMTARGLSADERAQAAGRAEALELALGRMAQLCEGAER